MGELEVLSSNDKGKLHSAQTDPAKSLPEQSAQPKQTKNKVNGFLLGLQSSARFVHCWKILIHWNILMWNK